ncbi:hypothetical protein SNOG_06587 [Parastagonospora nodorum SN15]|uniref:Uncharacterized protein n=1 Tax=Phaeosphaeria nodorum (strain SN15 / ATCC MYA-4574 / FGSC 10173) TaxID=321614 RepID=Q0UNS7_PHANO|nr:hypothetical protein SNOG_06587 [Parastagonospora nodorum SN15]EAT86418.2 hypothetical protein SNOG_06587 [Parastagonospora nodorum SN15]
MDSMYMRSPTTPTARKVPATPTPSKARATTSSQKRKTKAQSESSPTPGQKRKMKNEVGQEMNQYLKILTNWKVSPKNATPKGKGAGARSQPGKKQKVAYKENESKEADVVKSCDLDTYAYVLWDWCLRNKNGQLHAYANRYGAMIAEHKLRILACLNLLPSWFFLRSQILTWLQNQGWTIDDSDMHAQAADVTPHIQEIISRQHRSAILAQQNQRNQQSQEAQEAQQGMGN